MATKQHFDFAERPSESNRFRAILLVDDNREFVQTLQWIFSDQNFLVDKAYDGEEAMLKVTANEYDAVLCDVMMPRLRGDEFYLRAIAGRPFLANRFVFVTGYAADPKINLFLSQYRVRCFLKPVRIPQLVQCVAELVA
jgi:CheY-like chemotaxis protein